MRLRHGLLLTLLLAAPAAAQVHVADEVRLTTGPCRILSGSGSPEGSVTAEPCSVYLRTSDGQVWRKDSGSGDTGWSQVSFDDPLGVSRGGSGRSTLTADALLYGDGTSAVGLLAAGAANTVLTGTGSTPAFDDTVTLSTLGLTGGVTSSLIPSATDTYDLGSPTRLWREGYLSELNAILFALETRTLFGGYSTVGHGAGTLAADVDDADTTIDFGQTMTVGDFVEIRAHDASSALSVEYVEIGSLDSGTTYNVTRDVDGSGANDWVAGTPFLVLGQSGDGRIDLFAYDGKPRAIFTRQGATYNAQTVGCALGVLNGYYGYVTDISGLACGDESGTNISIDATNGFRIRNGSDTPVHIDASGDATFEGDVTATTLTAGAGTIGGFTIGASALSATNLLFQSGAANTARVQVGSSSNVSGLNSCNSASGIGIWAGSTHANRATAPFRVECDGDATLNSATINGPTITMAAPTDNVFGFGNTSILATRPAGLGYGQSGDRWGLYHAYSSSQPGGLSATALCAVCVSSLIRNEVVGSTGGSNLRADALVGMVAQGWDNVGGSQTKEAAFFLESFATGTDTAWAQLSLGSRLYWFTESALLPTNSAIGLGDSTHRWDVVYADAYFSGTTQGATASCFSGNYTINDGLVTACVTSDERAKDLLGEWTPGLEAIRAITPHRYRYKEGVGFDASFDRAGFVAQDVQQVLPIAVREGPDGYLGLDTGVITAALVNAVQELADRVEVLEGE